MINVLEDKPYMPIIDSLRSGFNINNKNNAYSLMELMINRFYSWNVPHDLVIASSGKTGINLATALSSRLDCKTAFVKARMDSNTNSFSDYILVNDVANGELFRNAFMLNVKGYAPKAVFTLVLDENKFSSTINAPIYTAILIKKENSIKRGYNLEAYLENLNNKY